MSELDVTLIAVLADRYAANLARVRELATPLTEHQFWTKPLLYGNSFGHLVLHLTGNLNYYIGAQIANTGYVRDRDREFSEPNPPAKDAALERLDGRLDEALLWRRDKLHHAPGYRHPMRRPHAAPYRPDDLHCQRMAATETGISNQRKPFFT